MNMEVTVGLCVKNSERTIKQSVESIIGQNYSKDLIQLIVVDGRSKDKTLSIINEATIKTKMMVETYTDKGKGLGTARQIVVENAKGKYLIFVDADIVVSSDFVENHVKFMEENPDVGVAFGTPMPQGGTLIATVWDLYTSRGGSVGNDATIYRSEVLRQIGGFDTKIEGAAEDKDLMVRFRQHGWGILVNEKAKYIHKHRETVQTFWAEQSWFGRGDHYYHHKHGGSGTVKGKIPVGQFIWGLNLASKAYEQTNRKISFFLPFLFVFGTISWWYGFFKAHVNGYGHRQIL